MMSRETTDWPPSLSNQIKMPMAIRSLVGLQPLNMKQIAADGSKIPTARSFGAGRLRQKSLSQVSFTLFAETLQLWVSMEKENQVPYKCV